MGMWRWWREVVKGLFHLVNDENSEGYGRKFRHTTSTTFAECTKAKERTALS